MRHAIPSLALALAAVAGPATAQPDPVDRDLRCVLVMGIYGGRVQTDQEKQIAATGFTYYIGRLQGRDPALDIKAKLTLAGRRLTGVSELQPDFQRCFDELKAYGALSQEVAMSLKALGERRGVGQ